MEFTAQNIYDKVATHLFTQGRRSRFGSSCMYRDDLGNSCAVGCLIPNDEYLYEMEFRDADRLISMFKDRVPSIAAMEPFKDLLSHLQYVHDSSYNWSDTSTMRRALKEIATSRNLDPSILENLSFSWEK